MGGKTGFVQVQSLKNQALIADKCHVAESFTDRLRGLIGRKTLVPGEALLLPRCNNIHMGFMRIPIDVVFIRKEKRTDGGIVHLVSSVREGLRPWSLPVWDRGAHDTLELPAGTVGRLGIKPGDELSCTS